jgi:hypothetical protein
MNRRQKVAAVIGLSVMGLMILFPPWAISDVETGELEFICYALHTGPPEPGPYDSRASYADAVIYGRLLFFQIAIVGAVTAIVCGLLADRPRPDRGAETDRW